MSDKMSIRGIDPEGVADGDYVVTVAGGHVTGLTPASSGGGGEPLAPNAGRPPRLVPFGVKLRGGNIVPMDSAGNPWRTLYVNWSTKWDTIVKPQVDAAASVGANALRLIGDVDAVTNGLLTVDAYVAAYEQFVDYCANLGLYVYACGSGGTSWGGATKDQALVVLKAQATMLETKPNVIGIDVVQELGLSPALWSGSTQHDFVAYLFDALRTVTTLPLTCSVLGSSNDSAAQWSTPTTAAFADLVDFYDFHPYYDGMTAADLAPFIAANAAGKPLLLGEYGGTSTDLSVHEAGAAVSALPDVVGSFIWSVVDNGVSTDWALFDTTFAERTAVTDIFRTVPDREQFTAGGHIIEAAGAVLPARARLNFTGAGVTVADDAGNDATLVTIDAPTGGPAGRWEVVVTGTPPEPVTNADGTDWLYVEV